jgi:hypothetical protein
MEIQMNTERANLPEVMELSDAELDAVVGGDKSTGGTKSTSGNKNNSHEFLVVKMTEIFVSM